MDSLASVALAGLTAGLGVALPLGAIGVLIVREGIVHGFARAAATALAVGLVDTVYCAAALLAGGAIAPLLMSWGDTPLYLSGIVLIALGVWQLRLARRPAPPAAAATGDARTGGVVAGRWSTFVRFFGLTAINPLTLVYFMALASVMTTATSTPAASLVFILAVGAASLGWQLVLAGIGAVFSRAISPRTARVLGIVASAVVIALGCGILLTTAAA